MFICAYASSRGKRKSFSRKVNFRCFCWFPGAILVHQNGAPIWRLHVKLYKDAWNVSANHSQTVGHKDLRLGQLVYILVVYNISFSWLLPLDGFQFIFFVAWHWKRSISRYFFIYLYFSNNFILIATDKWLKEQQQQKKIQKWSKYDEEA